MRKERRLIMILLLLVATILLGVFIINHNVNQTNDEDVLYEWESIKNSYLPDGFEGMSDEELKVLMDNDIANLSHNYNNLDERMDWFIEYKEVISEYPKELHSMTIYEKYSEEELDLLFRIVQSETNGYGFMEAANVASVIFNRCNFNNKTITEVLTEKGQFTPYLTGVYKDAVVEEKTILACEFVFIFGDTTFGCVAFRSHKECPETWNGYTMQFADEAHCFYK